MDIVKVFGDNLRKYRNGLGLSQEAFADKCGLHRTYISAIECYRRSISLENIQRIADAFPRIIRNPKQLSFPPYLSDLLCVDFLCSSILYYIHGGM